MDLGGYTRGDGIGEKTEGEERGNRRQRGRKATRESKRGDVGGSWIE